MDGEQMMFVGIWIVIGVVCIAVIVGLVTYAQINNDRIKACVESGGSWVVSSQSTQAMECRR